MRRGRDRNEEKRQMKERERETCEERDKDEKKGNETNAIL